MSELDELYQETILDHNKNPRNFRVMSDTPHQAEGFNPLCGDRCTIYLRVIKNRIEDASFQGSGCAISKASASLMTHELKGKSVEEAERLFQQFHTLVTHGGEADPLGTLAVFSGVSEFPMRVKCATLPWHTFQAALKGGSKRVSTE